MKTPMKKIILLLLLSTSCLFAQVELKDSKIFGLAGNGPGINNLRYGQVITSELYIGASLGYGKVDYTKRFELFNRPYNPYGPNYFSFYYPSLVEKHLTANVDCRYFLGYRSFRPFLTAGLGLLHSNYSLSAEGEQIYKARQFRPEVKVGFGFMQFMGKRKRVSFDLGYNYIFHGKIKTTGEQELHPEKNFEIQVGLNYRIPAKEQP